MNKGWQSRAICGGESPERFFPLSEKQEMTEAASIERELCWRCPVRRQCLEDALSTHSGGIWAGTTSAVREKISRNRSRQTCPKCRNQVLDTEDSVSYCAACALSWRIAP